MEPAITPARLPPIKPEPWLPVPVAVGIALVGVRVVGGATREK